MIARQKNEKVSMSCKTHCGIVVVHGWELILCRVLSRGVFENLLDMNVYLSKNRW